MVAQLVKNLPAMQETQVQFLGQEDPLEKETATHSNILALEILWTEESGRLHSWGSKNWTGLSDETTTTIIPLISENVVPEEVPEIYNS